MKKTLILLAIILICLSFYNNTVYADEKSDIKEELEGNVGDNLDKIDFGQFDEFLSRVFEDGQGLGEDIRSFVESVIKGEQKLGFSDFLSIAARYVSKEFTGFIPLIVTIVAIAILFSMIDGLSSSFMNKGTTEIIYFVCYSAIIVIITGSVGVLLADVVKTCNTMFDLMAMTFPILLTLMTALGGVVSVSAYKPLMAVLTGTIGGIITKFVIPCFIVSIVFAIAGSLSKNIKLDKMTKSVKSVGEFVLGLIFSLFTTFVTLEGITGSVIDGISVKSAKFAIGSYVPVLGGYLSEGFDLVLASCVLIKNALGFTGIIVMLLIVIAPIIKIAVFSIVLKLVAGIVEPLCDSRISSLIYSISKSMTLLIAILLGTAFMFLIMSMLVIYTLNIGI